MKILTPFCEVAEAAHSSSVESFWFDEVKPSLTQPLTEASHLKFHSLQQ